MTWRSKGHGIILTAAALATVLHAGLKNPKSERDEYVGAKVCATCHPTQAARHGATGHARSLSLAHEHPWAGAFVPSSPRLRMPGYYFQFWLSSDEFKVQVFDDRNVLEIPVDWAFGAGEQAVTFVTRVDRDWYLEHYYSYYPLLGSLAPTPGHEAIVPKTLPEAAGLMYQALDPKAGILGCFECHSTGPVAVAQDGAIQPSEPGVQCESCHGPGGQHAAVAASGELDRAQDLIENPGRLSAAELNQFCGTCHRPPAGEGVQIDWSYPWNVRHKPVYFSQSACFQKSNNALSCLTCHDPHRPARKDDPVYYDGKCTTCHSVATHSADALHQRRQPTDCVDCHMPTVVPQPPLRFSNHWIGIYENGAKLRPSR